MMATNNTCSSTVQVTSDKNLNVLLTPPISTRSADIARNIEKRTSDYAKLKIQQKIGEYMVTCNRDLAPAQARYLYNEEALARGMDVFYNLNEGLNAFIENETDIYEKRQTDGNDADERLDNFWKWIIMQAPKGRSVKKVLHDADIVCCRDLLERIARTAYDKREAWEFFAIRFNDVIFLCEQERYIRWHDIPEDLKLYLYGGLKFEQYMTTNEPNEEPRTDKLVAREAHVVVFCSTLGSEYGNSLKLVYNASIDAIKAGGKLVKLTTRRYAQSYHLAKDLSCFLQSFLLGIAHIYVGYHNDDGIVTRVEHVPTWELLQNHKDFDGRRVSASTCMHLLSDVLNSIRSALQNGEACKVRYAKNASEITIHPALLTEVDFFKNTNFREHFNLL